MITLGARREEPLSPAHRAANQAANKVMRESSGMVDSNDPLVLFLYQLGRDSLPLGEIERLAAPLPPGTQLVQFTNGWLATWAQDLANRLRGGTQ